MVVAVRTDGPLDDGDDDEADFEEDVAPATPGGESLDKSASKVIQTSLKSLVSARKVHPNL